MTTEEFENKLCNLGYNSTRYADWIIVFNVRSAVVLKVNIKRIYALNTDYSAFTDDLYNSEQQELIQVIDTYVKTPVYKR